MENIETAKDSVNVFVEIWNVFSVETANVFCFSEVIWSFFSWETWILSSQGTFFSQGISVVVVKRFSQQIWILFCWAKRNIFLQGISLRRVYQQSVLFYPSSPPQHVLQDFLQRLFSWTDLESWYWLC